MLRCKFLTEQFFCEELGVGSVPLLVSLFWCCIIHVFYQQNNLKTFAKIVWHIIIKSKHFSWEEKAIKIILVRIDLIWNPNLERIYVILQSLKSPKTKGTKSFQASRRYLFTHTKNSSHGFNESVKSCCTIRFSSFRINHCLKPWSGVLYMVNSHTVAVWVPNAVFYIESLFYIEYRIYTCTVTCI